MIDAESSLKKATGAAPSPRFDNNVAKKPIVPQSAPAVNTIKYPLFCSEFILRTSFPFTHIT